MWYPITALLVVIASSSLSAFDGYWYTQDQESVIKISEHQNEYLGVIVWMKEPYDENGEPWYDTENPNTLLQQQKISNLLILKKFQLRNGSLKGGTIYDPNTGKSYQCSITLNGDELLVRGYIGIPILGRTERWTKCNQLPLVVSQ